MRSTSTPLETPSWTSRAPFSFAQAKKARRRRTAAVEARPERFVRATTSPTVRSGS